MFLWQECLKAAAEVSLTPPGAAVHLEGDGPLPGGHMWTFPRIWRAEAAMGFLKE